MELLGKDLSEYKVPNYYIEHVIEYRSHNILALGRIPNEHFEERCYGLFVFNGNELRTTSEIIAAIHAAKRLSALTDEQFERAIPIIEKGLKMNIEYVELLDKLHPIIEEYCEKYGECFRHTLAERFKLEFWQGRFSKHDMNPKQLANYS